MGFGSVLVDTLVHPTEMVPETMKFFVASVLWRTKKRRWFKLELGCVILIVFIVWDNRN